MFTLLCLLCLRFAIVSIVAQSTVVANSNETCQGYPLLDPDLESQGIYTGYRVPDKMLVFEVSEKSILTVERYPGSNETLSVWKLMTVRDVCPMIEKTLSPNLTELLLDWAEECFTGPSQGSRDIYSLLGRQFMAVWTFVIPANQCFSLKLSLRIQEGQSDYYEDKITIVDGELVHPVVLTSGVVEYGNSPHNDTTSVSVVYTYTSKGRSLYWKVAPSLKTSDCWC